MRFYRVPTINTFYGVLIHMFFNDHAPPHFHARYGVLEATINISDRPVVKGELPRWALNLVREWTVVHETELLEKDEQRLLCLVPGTEGLSVARSQS